jgi:O-antigen/teichoic acid export membrane protein
MSAPSKASIVFLMVSMIQKGLAYITTPIYTNLLTTDEYGKVAVFLTWFQLIGIVAMFSLQAGVFNNGMLEYKDKRDEYMLSMLALSNLITAVSGIVLIVGFKFWNRFMRLDMPLIILMLLLFLTQPAMNFWQSRQRFSYKYKALAIATVSSCIVSPVAAVICILI